MPGLTVVESGTPPATATTEDGGTDTFTVRLATQPSGTVTVGISVTGDAPDEATVSPASLTFSDSNWDTVQTVTVTGQNDNLVDGPQAYTITLTSSSSDNNYSGLSAMVSGTNADDDPGLIVAETGGLTETTEGSTDYDTFTVRLSTKPTHNVAMSVTVAVGDTTECELYRAADLSYQSSISLGWTPSDPDIFGRKPWYTPIEVRVRGGRDDNTYDGIQDCLLTLTSSSSDDNYSGLSATVTVKNADNDPGLAVSKTEVSTSEPSGADTFKVKLATQPTMNRSVTVAVSGGGDEASASPANLTFNNSNWNTEQTVTVTGQNDNLMDGPQAYTITLTATSADPGYSGLSATVSGTNADDDAGLVVSETEVSTSEPSGADTFTVKLTTQPTADVTVAVVSSDAGEATVSASSLTFSDSNWNTAQTVTVTGQNDNLMDGPQAYTITLNPESTGDSDYDGLSNVEVSGTNADDDAGLVVSETAVSTSEPSGADTFTVKLTTQPTADVTVAVSSSATDEATVSASSLTFTDSNWNTAQTVTVTGQNDNLMDGPQPYTITLTPSSTGDSTYNTLSASTVSGTNADDDAGLVVSEAEVSTSEPSGTDTFTVKLTTRPTAGVTVAISSSDTGEAMVSASLTFSDSNWNTAQTVTVTGQDDSDADGPQAYTITLTATSGDTSYNNLSATVSGTNADDDAGLVVSETAVETSEPSGADTFTVKLATQPTADVTVAVSSSDTGEATARPASLTFTRDNWNTVQTVTVTGVDDSEEDGPQTYTITLTPSSTGDSTYNALPASTVSGRNVDNNTCSTSNPCVTLELSRSEIKELATAPTGERRATVTATLSHAAPAATTITVSAEAGTNAAVAADHVTLSANRTLTIAMGAKTSTGVVTITAVDDQIDSLVKTPRLPRLPDEPDRVLNGKLVTVSGTVSSGMALTPSSESLKIFEDDLAALVYTLTQSTDPRCRRNPNRAGCTVPYLTVKESGSGNTDTFQVKLATQPTANVTVAVSSADDGEGLVSKAGDAAPAGRTTLTFTPQNWNANQTVTLTGVDDEAVDGDQEYKVNVNPNSVSTDAYSLRPRTQGLQAKTEDTTVPLTVTLAVPAPATINESGSGNSTTVSATLNRVSSVATTVTVTEVAGAYTVPSSANTITIAAGQTTSTGTVTITAVDNNIDEGASRAVTVTGTAQNSKGVGTVTGVSLTITDDDEAGLTLSQTSGLETYEAGFDDDFTVRLATEPTGTVTVTITSSGQVTVSPASLKFGAAADSNDADNPVYKWNDARTVTVSSTDDSTEDGAQAFTLTLDPSSPGSSGDSIYEGLSSATVSGDDLDDDYPEVTVALSPTSISENGGTATVTATLAQGSTSALTVTVNAVAGAFTVPTAAKTISFTARSATSTDSVTITAVDNDTDEPNRMVTVRVTGSRQITSRQPILTLEDDDDAPTVTLAVEDSTIKESSGTASETMTTVTATLSHPSSEATTITVTPVAGAYMVGADATITIAAGETANASDTASITAADNDIDVGVSRQVTVTGTAQNSQGAGAVTGATLTITDNDTAALTVSETAVMTGEGGVMTDTFTVQLKTQPTGTVTVAVSSDSTDEATVSPASLKFGAAADAGNSVFAWNDARTVTVTGVDDSEEDGAQTYMITLDPSSSGSSGDSIYHALSSVTLQGTNADNDTCSETNPCVTLSLSQSEIYEDPDRAAGQRRAAVTASLDYPAPATTTITVSAVPGTNAAADDFTLSGNKTLTIVAGQQDSTGAVTITAENDQIDSLVKTPRLLDEDGDDTGRVLNGKLVTVSGTVSSGTASAPSSASLKIFEDDLAALVYSRAPLAPPDLAPPDRFCTRFPNSPGCASPYLTVKESGSGNTATFQVKLATQPTADVTVAVSSADDGEGLVSKAADAAPAGRTTLTFTPQNWNANQTVTLTGVDDEEADGDQEYKVNVNPNSVSTDAYSLRPRTQGLQAKTEDTTVPLTVTLAVPAPATINESGLGNSTTVSATLNRVSSVATTVTVAAVTGAYTVGSNATLTVAAGSTSSTGTVTITAVDNDIDEGASRAVTVTGTAQNSKGVSAVMGASLTITDDDAAALTVAESGGSTATTEASGAGRTDTFTVRLATVPSETVTIAISGGDTGEATVSPASLKFGATADSGTSVFAWNDPQTVTVTGVDDNSVDGNQPYTITMSATSSDTNYDSLSESVSGTNADDDMAGLTVSETAVSTTEAGGTDTFTVRLATVPSGTVTIAISSSATGEATVSPASLKFAETADSGTSVFAWNDAQDVTVTGVDDSAQDGNQSYTITVSATSSDTNYDSLSESVSGTNADDDMAALTVVESDGSTATTEAGGTDTFTVRLATVPSGTVTIAISSSATGEATVSPASLKFAETADSGTSVFAWNDAQDVTVTGVDDSAQDGNQSYTITVSATSSDTNYDSLSESVSGTNADDDMAALTVVESDGSTATTEAGGTDTFTVRLATVPSGTVTIAISSSATGEATVSPASLKFGAMADGPNDVFAWNDPRTVTVTGVDDNSVDGDQSYTITLDPSSSGASGDSIYHALSSVTLQGTNADDDMAGLTVVESGSSTATTEASGAGRTDTFTVRLATVPSGMVTIAISSSATGEATVSPASLKFGATADSGTSVFAWNAAQTVTVTGVDDSAQDGAQSYTITLNPSSEDDSNYDGLSNVEVSGTNADDDMAALTVVETSGSTATTEASGAGQTDTFTVRLATVPSGTVTIAISSDAPDEATVSPASLKFGPTADSGTSVFAWNDAQDVTVTGVDDNSVDGNQSYTITLNPESTGDSDYDGLSNVEVSGTNADDDMAGLTVSATSVSTTEASGTGQTDTFTVRLATVPSGTVTIAISSSATGEATVSPASLKFAAAADSPNDVFAWNDAQDVTVTGVDDNSVDGNQSYTITLNPESTADSNYDGLSNVEVSGTNADDDMAGLTVVESDGSTATTEAGGTDTFTVRLATVPSGTVTIAISSSATGEATVSPASLKFAAAADSPNDVFAWNDAQDVTVTGVDDSSVDGSQSYTITLDPSSPDANYNGLSDSTVSGTNADDDMAGLTVVESGTPPATETTEASGAGQTDTFTVRLATVPSATVTVGISVTGGDTDEATVSPASLKFGATADSGTSVFAWNDPQTVTVTGVDDSDSDGPQSYTITLAATSTDTNYNSLSATVSGTNVDDEPPPQDPQPTVTLSLSSASISENGGSATVTASLSRASTEATTITLTAPAGTSLSGTTLTIDAGETSSADAATAAHRQVTITAVDNSIDAPDRTVTVAGTASGGEEATGPASLTLTITDDEEAPTVTLTATAPEIWESGAGSSTTVSARLSHASSMATTITIQPVAGLYTVGADNTIVIPAGQTTSTDRVTITAVDNAQRSASDPTVMITGDVSNAQGTGAMNAAAVVVLDDETASVSLELAPERVAEGAAARVTAVLNRAAPAAVTVTVSAAPGTAATAASFALGSARTLTVAAGATRSAGTVTITATDDAVDAPDRTVTVSGAVSSENRAREPEAVTLTIEDDDETPVATLSLTPAVIDESGANNASAVSATLSNPSSEATTITVSASGMGYAQSGTTLTIPALGTTSAGAVTLTAVDDEEQTPDREVTVSGRAENAHGVEQPAAVVLTIRDDDGMEMVTEVLLPEAARAMADSRATAVRQRLERAGTEETAELPSLTGLLAQHGPSAQEDSLEWKTLLPQASFALALDADGGGAGGGVTVWGGGDYRNLDGEARGVSWDGEVASAHLGADRLLANGMRVGVAASWSEAKFDYEHKGRSGDWELEMSSAQPYLGWTTAGGIDLWASAGVGSGELELSDAGGRQSSDADMWLAAAGARGPLYATDSGLQVSLRGEALYSSFEVDGNGSRIRGHTSDVSRLRLALEARRERTLESGARLSPRFELGLRHDGGDGETGAGLELGGGAEYVSGRLTLAGGARALAANSDYDEWGAEAALEYAAGADGRGLTLRLAPSWGAAQSGAAQLWEQGAPGLDGEAAEPDLGGRLAAELGYGLKSPWSRGLLTLALGGELGEDEGVAARLSGRVAPDGTSTLGLALELREPKSGATEYGLMLTGELRF